MTKQDARNHPYHGQPEKAFWRKTVADRHVMDISNWYQKKFPLANKVIATAGSCFAQHIGRHLKEKKFRFLDAEPAPNFLSPDSRLEYGYDMYSARYGNVYTTRQLLQLLQRALGEFTPRENAWKKGAGVVDPFRPTIEPEPFVNMDELLASRDHHLSCVRDIFTKAEVFIFLNPCSPAITPLPQSWVPTF